MVNALEQRPAAACPPTGKRRPEARWLRPSWNSGLGLLLCAGSAVVGSGQAQESFDLGNYLSYNWGPLVVQPQLDTQASFTDNVFRTRSAGKESDFNFAISPGLNLRYGTLDGNFLKFGYAHDEFLFLDNSQVNSSQDRFDFGVSYEVGKLKVAGKDSVHLLSGLLGGAQNQFGNVVDRLDWTDDYRLTWDITEKTDLYGEFFHQRLDFDGNVGLVDVSDLRGTLGGTYKYSPKLGFFTEGFYGRTSARPNTGANRADSAVYGGFVGARGEITPKISGVLKIGYERRDFTDGGSLAADTPAVSLDFTYALSAKTLFILGYERSTSTSPQLADQLQVADAVSARAVQYLGTSGKWSLQVQARYFMGDLSDIDRQVGPFLVNLGRDDAFLTAGLTANYQPKPWLTVSGGYSFEHFDVTYRDRLGEAFFQLTDYAAHRVFVSVSLGY
jgi:hypothetical protein